MEEEDFCDPANMEWGDFSTAGMEELSSDIDPAEQELTRLRNLHLPSIMKVYEGCDAVLHDLKFKHNHKKIKQGKASLASVIKTLSGERITFTLRV
jgi:hypothetical protein